MNSLQPDGTDDPVRILLTLKFIDDFMLDVPSEPQYSDQELAENLLKLDSNQFLLELHREHIEYLDYI